MDPAKGKDSMGRGEEDVGPNAEKEHREVLGHGHMLSRGSAASLPRTPLPATLLLSRCLSPTRRSEILAIDAPSWHMLLQGLVWKGNVSIEPALVDLERMSAGGKLGPMTASPALSFLKFPSKQTYEYRVRLYLTLNPPGKSLSPLPAQPSASRSGITEQTRLPYIVDLDFFHVVLPISFSQLALQLAPLGQLALTAADSVSSVRSMKQRQSFPHADIMTLRELGQSFQFIAHQNDVAVDYSDEPSFGSGDYSLSSSFPLRNLTHRVRHSVRSKLSSSPSPSSYQFDIDTVKNNNPDDLNNNDKADLVEDADAFEQTTSLFNNPFSRRRSSKASSKKPTRSMSHSSTSDIPTQATFITPFNLNDYA